jgi:hypothetical protein
LEGRVQRMKRTLAIISCIFVLTTGCSQKEKIKTINEAKVEDLQKYKETLVGNNSAISSIVNSLPGGSTYKEIELSDQSIKVVYGIKTDRENLNKDELNTYWLNDNNIENNFLYNATAIFILVKNVQRVTLELESEKYYSFSISREELIKELPHSLDEYVKNKKLWEDDILNNLIMKKEKREEFFKKYPVKQR